MAKPLPAPFDKAKVVAENRRARYDYFVEERFEAGIELMGTEVKALRTGEGSIAESYATVEDEQVYLINSSIPQYGNRGYASAAISHDPALLALPVSFLNCLALVVDLLAAS